jgi:hypothetical protein
MFASMIFCLFARQYFPKKCEQILHQESPDTTLYIIRPSRAGRRCRNAARRYLRGNGRVGDPFGGDIEAAAEQLEKNAGA